MTNVRLIKDPVKQWMFIQSEVLRVNTKLGWWDQPVSFTTAMALLHSEVSEMLEAWRGHGFADFTHKSTGSMVVTGISKPEGVGSEMADVMIRLADDAERYKMDLAPFWGAEAIDRPGMSRNLEFPQQCDILHVLIAQASIGFAEMRPMYMEERLGVLLIALQQLAPMCQVNLLDEYVRKIRFNETRPYRHGKKV